eukprot:CAMPEP_0179213002 /NCGR_PEP_ID=MMETSP0797-20121207/1427_1 /TAXON_ID=47934 /ORGANISM="Dinophysis acuminata, Strain DAEP01" /LENGTH=146 /DNA_ID=CAMNT_0020918693 /DNA_START=76 /DNA_END=516 /DNA_ORIENTATION=+
MAGLWEMPLAGDLVVPGLVRDPGADAADTPPSMWDIVAHALVQHASSFVHNLSSLDTQAAPDATPQLCWCSCQDGCIQNYPGCGCRSMHGATKHWRTGASPATAVTTFARARECSERYSDWSEFTNAPAFKPGLGFTSWADPQRKL